MKVYDIDWTFCPCTPQQFCQLGMHHLKFLTDYHTERGDINLEADEWVCNNGEYRRTVKFLAPINAPQRLLKIIRFEYTTITEQQIVTDSTTTHPVVLGIFQPDVLPQYSDIKTIWKLRPVAGGCEIHVRIEVTFKMPLIGHLFEVCDIVAPLSTSTLSFTFACQFGVFAVLYIYVGFHDAECSKIRTWLAGFCREILP